MLQSLSCYDIYLTRVTRLLNKHEQCYAQFEYLCIGCNNFNANKNDYNKQSLFEYKILQQIIKNRLTKCRL